MTRQTEDLSARLAVAVAAYKAMSPVDKALHDADQKRSFVRGQCGRDPGEDVLAAEVRRLRAALALPPSGDVADVAGLVERLRYKAAWTEGFDEPLFTEAATALERLSSELEAAKAEVAALERVEHRVCVGCGSSWHILDIAGHGTLACCPERKMLTAKEWSVRAEAAEACAATAEAGLRVAKAAVELASDVRWQELAQGAQFTIIDQHLLADLYGKARRAAQALAEMEGKG